MNSEKTREMLLAIAVMFQEKRDELSKLDSVIGDGDHGISMARGAKEAFENISNMGNDQPVNEYFKVYGRSLVAKIGGAMGPLFGIVFTEFGKCMKGKEELTAEEFAKSLGNSLKKVMEFGGAKPNDKTMVDAMEPAALAAKEAVRQKKTLTETARIAACAAKQGVEATIGMRARRGRSKFLQEKSIGHQDAGATSYFYLIDRMARYLEGDTGYGLYQELEDETLKDKEKSVQNGIHKFINCPTDVVEETVRGYIKAYGDKIKKLPHAEVVTRRKMTTDKVGIVIGNGSGHEPACLGFVGENMLDANAYGGIFAAPGPYTILEAIRAADMGRGVCVLISNHAGDVLNSKMAIDMAEDEGIQAESVVLYDDIASAPKSDPIWERRGAIGTLFNYKMTPSYAPGHTMKEIVTFSEKVRDNTRSIAAAMSPGTSPITGEIMFQIEPGEVLVGLGIHGESALLTFQNKKCSQIAESMICSLLEDLECEKGEEISMIVNGAGKTTMMELMIFYEAVEKVLARREIKIFKPLIGSFITTQEMGGIGLAICRVQEEMKIAWTAPTNAPQFPNLSL
ncbi:MAG: dihydroxyacetone kinase subunit DhaL [Lachnospiraceae bacterium]